VAGTGRSDSSEEVDDIAKSIATLTREVLATGSAAMILASELSGRDERPMAVSPVAVADVVVADAIFFLLRRLAPD
jgi:hypothetical protein